MKNLKTFEAYSILGRTETVKITNDDGESVTSKAKIDTGSYSSRISPDIAKQLKLSVVDNKEIISSMGSESRTFVELQFNINGIEIKTIAGISDMSNLRNEVSIGRRDIEMVDGIVDVKKKDNGDVHNESKKDTDLLKSAHHNSTTKRGRPEYSPDIHEIQEELNKIKEERKLQKESEKLAKSDIGKHFNKLGDPFDDTKPVEDWRKYQLKYDTDFADMNEHKNTKVKLFEEHSVDIKVSKYEEFRDWLYKRDFELYNGAWELKRKFIEVYSKDTTSIEKSEEIADFMEDKWGLYDGYKEIVEFLKLLF